MDFMTFLSPLPSPPTGSLPELAAGAIDFFSGWISRIGELVAFIGGVKFALAFQNEDAREQLQSALIMVSGFMIVAAVNDLSLFEFGASGAEAEFQSILTFISAWVGRIGGIALLLGAVILALALKDKDAAKKITGLKTMAAGGMTSSLALMLPTFVR
jgi:hypothetical protein